MDISRGKTAKANGMAGGYEARGGPGVRIKLAGAPCESTANDSELELFSLHGEATDHRLNQTGGVAQM